MGERIREFFKQKKWQNLKKGDWVALALTGVLLLVIAMPLGEGNGETSQGKVQEKEKVQEETVLQSQTASEDAYAEYLEKKLKDVLESMEGVGKVKVMITLSDSGASIVEKDKSSTQNSVSETDSSGGTRITTEREENYETVYVETEGETYPYVGKEVLPGIEGVVIVAEGGGNSKIVSDISDAVMALFPVEAHRIKVVKMCSKEE